MRSVSSSSKKIKGMLYRRHPGKNRLYNGPEIRHRRCLRFSTGGVCRVESPFSGLLVPHVESRKKSSSGGDGEEQCQYADAT